MTAAHGSYRGRLAPSPTGYLHMGHARTFWVAAERARQNGGSLVLRIEDLDGSRCKPEFTEAIYEDLRWLGIDWQEGPDTGGQHEPYQQSERVELYHRELERLISSDHVYPCTCSRLDVQRSVTAPHGHHDEPIYPGRCRERYTPAEAWRLWKEPSTARINWRYRVEDGEAITFEDGCAGHQSFRAGDDFGDFVVWRHDQLPAYQLAAVVDDAAMRITEVVRGADLLKSTARQILLYGALGYGTPLFFHCPLMLDSNGERLAKRHDALSLRALRLNGTRPESLTEKFAAEKIA